MAEKPKPELRIALAMRGGVSLAVWMGGACAELDALRRARPEDDQELYAKILHAAGYGSAAVDVIAGASAGGLNGVLMGCTVAHGMPFGANIRDLWLQLGDLATLSRPWGKRSTLSPLDGDGAFFAPLADKLEEMTRGAEPPTRAPRVDLSLTGTLLFGRDSSRFQDLGRPITESRNRARFRFRHLPVPPSVGAPGDVLSDFRDGADLRPALHRLAYAARATSSFPGAFEPASVGYGPGSTTPGDRGPVPPTHHGVFSESRPGSGPGARDQVVDGGVLDNIPVAWAVRSVAAAPAGSQVDRWLLYLQPLPFRPGRAAGSTSLGDTVQRALSLRSGVENLTDDIDEMERLRSEQLARLGFAQILEYALGQVPTGQDRSRFLGDLFERAARGVPAYRARLGRLERDRVRRLWIDPMPVLGVDPLGFHDLDSVNADQTRADEVRRQQLLDDLADAPYEGVLPEGISGESDREVLRAAGRALRTPQFLARTVALLLDTARWLGAPAYETKRRIYDVRTEIELLVACHDRYLAAEPVHEAEYGAGNAGELVRRAAWRLELQPTSAEPHWGTAGGEPRLPDGWPRDPSADLLTRLADLARELADVASGAGPEAPGSGGQRQLRALLSCLLIAAEGGDDAQALTEAVLVAVEVLTGPLRPDPFAQWDAVRFHMLTAANPSPLASLRPGGVPLGVEKLAGNQVGNFGAFLSARWRLNDWVWGRLDAAWSLVQVVTERAEDDPAARAALTELARLPGGAGLPEVRDALVSLLHRRILEEELPLFTVVDDDPPTTEQLDRPLPAEHRLDVRPLLEVGGETVPRLFLKHPSAALTLGRVGAVAATGLGRTAGERLVTSLRRR